MKDGNEKQGRAEHIPFALKIQNKNTHKQET